MKPLNISSYAVIGSTYSKDVLLTLTAYQFGQVIFPKTRDPKDTKNHFWLFPNGWAKTSKCVAQFMGLFKLYNLTQNLKPSDEEDCYVSTIRHDL